MLNKKVRAYIILRYMKTNKIYKEDGFFIFLTLYTIVTSLIIQRNVNEGIHNINELIRMSLLPLYFILIFAYINDILNFKIINNNLFVIFIKSFLFTIIPILLSAIVLLRIKESDFDNIHLIFLVVFILSFYWFLLTTVSIMWLKWKSVFVLLLFISAPGISELMGNSTFKKYLPFEIIFTIIENTHTRKILILDFVILLVYITTLLIGLKINKYEK